MGTQRRKILIVKLGYSETLLPIVGQTCSLGDVFRTTAILHLFKDDHVTWLTDHPAVPLLEGNPLIHRLLTFDLLSVLQLLSERFDKVINLEKVPGICSLVNRISAWSKYGFRLDEETGDAQAFELAHEAFTLATVESAKRLNDRPWVDVLYKLLGATWKGENYVLGYKPSTAVQYDLGFNTNVGKLIPQKAWPTERWQQLERLVQGRFTYSYQQHLNDLNGYMDWIHSCRMLVTSDSLGLYLGVAMNKKVLALFGPTPSSDQSPSENLRLLNSPAPPEAGDACMAAISAQSIFNQITQWMGK